MSRFETIAWCLAPVVLAVSGFGVISVLVLMVVAITVRWLVSCVLGAFGSVLGSIIRPR